MYYKLPIIDKLNKKHGRLSKSHRKLAIFINDHYDKAVYMTAGKIAEFLDLSESTVVRFATAMGYDGFPQMQRTLQEIIRHRLTNVQRFELTQIKDEFSAVQSVLNMDMRNLKSTLEGISKQTFENVIDTLSNAQHIYVLGLRSAAPIADFFAHYLKHIFPNVTIVNNIHHTTIFESISRIDANDVLFAISFPRYSTRTLESISFAHSRGAKVIGLTDGPLSPIHDTADMCLDVQTELASFVDSMAAPMALINALLTALGFRHKERLMKHYNDLEGIWEKYRVYANKE